MIFTIEKSGFPVFRRVTILILLGRVFLALPKVIAVMPKSQ